MFFGFFVQNLSGFKWALYGLVLHAMGVHGLPSPKRSSIRLCLNNRQVALSNRSLDGKLF